MAITIVMKSGEVKLMEGLGAIHDPNNWYAIDFHLGNLLEQYKSEYQIKIAVNLVHDLVKEYDGAIFLMGDQSIVVLCKNLNKALQNKLIFQLRYLYMDDPLAYTEDGQENRDFCTAYDLVRDWQMFWDISTRRMAVAVRKNNMSLPVIEKRPETSEAERRLSASRLAHIEQDVRRIDLSRIIRRQPVCAALPGKPVRRVFDELYVHIQHMRQVLKADVDFFSNRWLFKYLTQILDERMIDMIRSNPTPFFESPISLNLNMETLLSDKFAAFDALVPPSIKVSVIFEVPVVDAFADFAGFTIACKEAQAMGYRICLDGVTAGSFLHIDREKFGVDLVKVQWNASGANDLTTAANREFARAVQKTGTNRIILCRCDDKPAVEFGQALGISLFQGRYLDSLLNPGSRVEN